MLLAQSDAKFKYCPLLKTKDDKLKFCLGAMCMLWRWESPAKTGDDERGYCGVGGSVAAMAALSGGDDQPQRPVEDY